MRKKYCSSLNKGHHFVLSPLGRIGPCFCAGELVGLSFRHVLDAVLMRPLARPLGPRLCEICSSGRIASKLVRQSAAPEYESDCFRTLNQRVPGSPTKFTSKSIGCEATIPELAAATNSGHAWVTPRGTVRLLSVLRE